MGHVLWLMLADCKGFVEHCVEKGSQSQIHREEHYNRLVMPAFILV